MSTPIETEELTEQTAEQTAQQPAEPAPEEQSPKPMLGDMPSQTLETRSDDFTQTIDPRDREFIDALGKMLDKHSRPEPKPEEPPAQKFALGIVKKGVGVVSLALILVMMGTILICCFFSSAPDYLLAVKLAPVAAVLVGLELLVHYFTSGKHFRVHFPSIIISALIVVGCCFMATSLNKSYNESKEDYNNRSVAAEIYDSSYKELRYVADISKLTVDVELNPDGTGYTKGYKSLSSDDYVDIKIELGGGYSSPKEFAAECKNIIDVYRILGIPVRDFSFICNTKFSTFTLNVTGRFQQEYSEKQLAEQVHYVYVEEYDYIDDLEDYEIPETEETQETEENI